MDLTTTIVAISTPPGVGAIAIVRLSGAHAVAVANAIFCSPAGKKLSAQKPYTLTFGKIMHRQKVLDEVLAAVFRAPHSYTGQDMVEFYCHGSTYIQQQTLQALVESGAQPAQAGEFTMRAFANGKIDLAQAEAVGDLIASSTQAMHRIAMQQMRGGYSEEIRALRDKLLHFSSLLELELDFSEEDVEFANREKLNALLTQTLEVIDRLVQSFAVGNAIKKGIPVVIAGKPNVGKSTLLNALLNDDKALVSDIAGTTRDAIEDTVALGGTLFRFIDTAGLRSTTDSIEMLGIERSRKKIAQAHIVLLVADSNEAVAPVAESALALINEAQTQEQKKFVLLLNKADVLSATEAQNKVQQLQAKLGKTAVVLAVSAKNKMGIEAIEQHLVQFAALPQNLESNSTVSNLRHYEAFVQARQSLTKAQQGLAIQLSEELIAFELRQSIQHLNNIIGEISDTDILNNIFKNFCVGK